MNELFKIMCCTLCHSDIRIEKDKIFCDSCNVVYPIVNGIPCMRPGDAKKVEE